MSEAEAVNSTFTSGERLSYNFNFPKPWFVYIVSRTENLPLMRSLVFKVVKSILSSLMREVMNNKFNL